MSQEEDEARERLLFHLENQTGFWFALVLGDDTRPRGRLREAAEAWCREHGRTFVLHDQGPESLVNLAIELAKGGSAGVHWIRTDGAKGLAEEWNEGATRMLLAMNERREAYRERLDGGIVVEGRVAVKRILREMAPDMFSIRAFIAELGDDPSTRSREAPEWRPPPGRELLPGFALEAERALEQLARFTAFGGKTGTEEWMRAAHSAVLSLMNEGRYEEAERHARDLLERVERRADESSNDDAAREVSSWAHLALGVIVFLNDHYNDASSHFDQAIELLSTSPMDAGDEREAIEIEVNNLRKLQGMALVLSGDLSAGRNALEQHVEFLIRSPARALPPLRRLDLVGAYLNLSDVLLMQAAYEEAERNLRLVVQHVEEFVADDPNEERWQFELIRCRTKLAKILLLRGRVAAAIGRLMSATKMAARLESVEPRGGTLGEVIEEAYITLSLALYRQGDNSAEGLLIHDRALAYANEQFVQAPDNSTVGWQLANLYRYRAAFLHKMGDDAGKDDALQETAALIARLQVQNDEQAKFKSSFERLRSSGDRAQLRASAEPRAHRRKR